MKNEMKTANDFSRNLDERTSDLMIDVYNEIKMSDKLFSPKEHNAQSDISEIVEDDNNRTEVVQFRVSKK